MKRLFAALLGVIISTTFSFAIDFRKVDDMFTKNEQFAECQKALETMLPQASNNKEKAEVLWRLSRVYLVKGQLETTKEGKKAVFGKGIEYAEQAIAADPNNPEGYIWHCANIGRECQTKPLLEQNAAVPAMTADISHILDELKLTNHAAAWHAIAEMYYRHPFKSNDAAANYIRMGIANIPAGEMRLSSYVLLAEILNARGLSADRRAAAINSDKNKFTQTTKSNIAKYAFYWGSLGAAHIPAWSDKALGQMSDKEEALALVNYALKLYDKASYHTDTDKQDFKDLTALKAKIK